LDLTADWAGYAALLLFLVAYLVVVTVEFTQLRQSKPMILAAGMIWAVIALRHVLAGDRSSRHAGMKEYLPKYPSASCRHLSTTSP
jgi:hypothetical protein